MFEIGKFPELLVALLAMVVALFEVVMIVHALKYRRGFIAKILWTAAIIVLPIVGAIYYFYWAGLYGRNKHTA